MDHVWETRLFSFPGRGFSWIKGTESLSLKAGREKFREKKKAGSLREPAFGR